MRKKQSQPTSYVTKTVLYLTITLGSYVVSIKVKEGFSLAIPSIIVIFEIWAVILFTSIGWHLNFLKKRTQEYFSNKLKIYLWVFGIFSVLYFSFVNQVFFEYREGLEQKATIVGFHSKNDGKRITDHQTALEGNNFIPEDTYSDLLLVKDILLVSSLVYVFIVASLMSIVIHSTRWESSNHEIIE